MRIPPEFLALALLLAPSVALADEPTITPSVEDEAFVRRLLGRKPEGAPGGDADAATRSKTDPLDELVREMRKAGDRVANDQTGDETRAIQRNVVSRLDEILKALEQAKQQRQPSDSQPPGPPMGNEPRPMDDPMMGDPMPDPSESTGEGGSSNRRRDDDENSAESTDVTEKGRETDLDPSERRRLVKDVWGHLPPALRDRMLSAEDERPLPKYADLVRRYFRALAERSNETE